MSPLERQYRVLLGLAYPESYLTHREEELIGTLLDTADPGQRRVRLRDAADLVRSGFAVRAESAAFAPVRRGSSWAGAVAMAALPAIAVFVTTVQLAGEPWNDDVPALLLPYWMLVAATPLLVPVVADRRRLAIAVVASLFGVGLIAGSGQVLVQPLTLLGIAMFAALAVLLPGPRRPLHIAAAVAIGVVVGAVGAARALTVLASPRYDFPRARDMFATQVVADLPEAATIHLLVIAIALVCVVAVPRFGIAIALLTPPVLLCVVTLVGNSFLYAGAGRTDKVRLLAFVLALGVAFTLTSTTRAIRRSNS